MKNSICLICNREIQNRRIRKFCSNKCVAEYNRQRLTGKTSLIKGKFRIPRDTRICPICKNSFVMSMKSTRKYCCKRCREIGVGLSQRGRFAWNRGLPNVNNKNYFNFKGGYRNDLGHFVRSSWEADFARILKYFKIDYEYEKYRFKLIGTNSTYSYCPDFYISETDCFYEIKGRYDPKLLGELFKEIFENYGIQVCLIPRETFYLLICMAKERLPKLYKNLENRVSNNKDLQYYFEQIFKKFGVCPDDIIKELKLERNFIVK